MSPGGFLKFSLSYSMFLREKAVETCQHWIPNFPDGRPATSLPDAEVVALVMVTAGHVAAVAADSHDLHHPVARG